MGGKSQPKAPDYSPVANASAEATRAGAAQADRELQFTERQYNEMKPLYDRIVNSQLASQDETQAQGRDYYNYLKDTYRPVEQGLVKDALNFDTAAYREKLAEQAGADASRAFAASDAATNRSMMAMGVNPNSGKFATAKRASSLGLAASRADAMNDTRTQADAMGWARRGEVAGLGRNLANNSTAAYGVAINAGNSAGNNAMQPGNQYMAGSAQAGDARMRGLSTGIQGYSQIMNTQASIYRADQDANAAQTAAIGQGIGAAAGLFAMSDRRLKTNIEQIGEYPNGLPMYEFSYIANPRARYRGVMADDVLDFMPEAVVRDHDGYMAVRYDLLGIKMEAVQ